MCGETTTYLDPKIFAIVPVALPTQRRSPASVQPAGLSREHSPATRVCRTRMVQQPSSPAHGSNPTTRLSPLARSSQMRAGSLAGWAVRLMSWVNAARDLMCAADFGRPPSNASYRACSAPVTNDPTIAIISTGARRAIISTGAGRGSCAVPPGAPTARLDYANDGTPKDLQGGTDLLEL